MSEELGEEIRFRFAAARLWAAQRAPYLASALYLLRPSIIEPRVDEANGDLVKDPRFAVFPTGTDWTVHLDPATALDTDAATLGWWLLHHIGHLVRRHAQRSPVTGTFAAGVTGFRDPESIVWNQAADAEINDDLEGEEFQPPADVISPERLGLPVGLVAEDYVSSIEVLSERARIGAGIDCGSCADGSTRDWDTTDLGGQVEAPSELDVDLLSRSIQGEITRRMSKRSDIPGGWQRWASEREPSMTDWRRILRSAVSRMTALRSGNVDFSYARPSRRWQAQGDLLMPSMVKPRPRSVVLVDTSCSVGPSMLGVLVDEVIALITAVGQSQPGVPVICCDTQAYPVQQVRDASQLTLTGGGGTDLRAGLAAAGSLRPRPDLILVVTDGDSPWPERRPPGSQVIVLLIDGDRAIPTWARAVVREPRAGAVAR